MINHITDSQAMGLDFGSACMVACPLSSVSLSFSSPQLVAIELPVQSGTDTGREEQRGAERRAKLRLTRQLVTRSYSSVPARCPDLVNKGTTHLQCLRPSLRGSFSWQRPRIPYYTPIQPATIDMNHSFLMINIYQRR